MQNKPNNHATSREANKLASSFTTDQGSEHQEKPRGLQSISEDLYKMEKILFIARAVLRNVRTQMFFPDIAGNGAAEINGIYQRIKRRRNRKPVCLRTKGSFNIHQRKKKNLTLLLL